MNNAAFSSLKLNADLLLNLETFGYTEMTPVQARSLPYILDGKDVIAQGKTGSGKTVAFALGLLQKLKIKQFCVQSLVLCPTRELADQVAKEIRRLARTTHNIKVLTLCGGMPLGPQIGSLRHGAHIVVGTPGRVEEHLRKGILTFDHLSTFVLDEADRMLEMGFQPSLEAIVEYMPSARQTLLFSATYPKQIASIAQSIMVEPVTIQVASTHSKNIIQQHFYHLDTNQQRLLALKLLLIKYQSESSIVFCNTKLEVQEITNELVKSGFSAVMLHGGLEQRDRDQTLVRFSNNSVSILVATDVAARGLDIDELDMVVNYQLARNSEIYIHRIGRTGRAGNTGIACTLYSDKEQYKVSLLEDYLDQVILPEPLPSESLLDRPPLVPAMETIQIDGGKKQKVRAGDILGALTGEAGITGIQVGKINIADNWAYVAVSREVYKAALQKLGQGKIKGRVFRARLIRGG